MFYDAVKTDSFWDHKWQLSALFPSMGLSRRYHHVYDDKDIPYDAWSNIHFGVIGRYCEFSESVLLDGADLAQRVSNFEFKDLYTFNVPEGDTLYDKSAIKIGFLIHYKYINHNTIYADEILSEIMNDDVFIKYFQGWKCTDDKNK